MPDQMSPRRYGSAVLALGLLALAGSSAWARPDEDRAAESAAKAVEAADKAAARAARDEARYMEDRARIEARPDKEPQRIAEELAKLEEDRQEDLAKAAEDAQKQAADAAEKAAKEAADLAEDAAKDIAENGGMSGTSEGMRDVGSAENPDHDSRGYPVRRGEVVALDLSQAGLARIQAKGYHLIAREDLATLGGSVTRLALPEGREPEAAIEELAAVEQSATFDYTHYYGLQVVTSGSRSAQGSNALPARSGNFTVGMIDTGIVRHPALARPQITARDFSRGTSTIPAEHGTAVASILASEGARALYVANIFRGGTGSPFTSAEAIASALEWMAANRVPVVNMSLSGPRNAILDRLIQRTAARGTLIVAAAGNGGPTAPPAYPAALPSVVAVTAVDAQLRVYRYANQGQYLDVAARGVNEPAARASGGTGLFTGTSFATPHVAARLAECMTGGDAGDCNRRLLSNVRDLGAPGHDPVYGYGLVR